MLFILQVSILSEQVSRVRAALPYIFSLATTFSKFEGPLDRKCKEKERVCHTLKNEVLNVFFLSVMQNEMLISMFSYANKN